MKFGVREICDVVFKAKAPMTIGTSDFVVGQPVLYIDTATASTLEQATTTVYAQGGRGNTRLITWEGEKTLTFTVTDALLSPISLSILAGAGLYQKKTEKVHVHTTCRTIAQKVKTESPESHSYTIDLSKILDKDDQIDGTAPIFVSKIDDDGDLTGTLITGFSVSSDGKSLVKGTAIDSDKDTTVFVDFYITKDSANVAEIQIDAASFGGNFYVEASTLFREQSTGKDLPCEITLPSVKIQSNFTFSMASTGDPSTFDFVMDAMPDYTMFDRNRKVMCVMQVVDDKVAGSSTSNSVMIHRDSESIDEATDKAIADDDANKKDKYGDSSGPYSA